METNLPHQILLDFYFQWPQFERLLHPLHPVQTVQVVEQVVEEAEASWGESQYFPLAAAPEAVEVLIVEVMASSNHGRVLVELGEVGVEVEAWAKENQNRQQM